MKITIIHGLEHSSLFTEHLVLHSLILHLPCKQPKQELEISFQPKGNEMNYLKLAGTVLAAYAFSGQALASEAPSYVKINSIEAADLVAQSEPFQATYRRQESFHYDFQRVLC